MCGTELARWWCRQWVSGARQLGELAELGVVVLAGRNDQISHGNSSFPQAQACPNTITQELDAPRRSLQPTGAEFG